MVLGQEQGEKEIMSRGGEGGGGGGEGGGEGERSTNSVFYQLAPLWIIDREQ